MLDSLVIPGKKEARLIIFILAVCFVGAFLLSYKLVINKNSTAKLATTKNDLNPINVSLTTKNKTVTNNSDFDVEIKIDSQETEVDAGDFIINFDKTVLAPQKIIKGSYFPSIPVTKINTDYVKVSGIATVKDNTIIVPTGEGTVATISFKALTPTNSAKISFDRNKTVIASMGKNVTGTLTDLAVKIK